LPLAIGFLLKRLNLFGPRFYEFLIRFSIFVVYPIICFLTFWVVRIEYSLLLLPIFGLILHAVPGLIAWVGLNKKYERPEDRGSYLLSAICSNHFIVGGLSVFLLYGESGFAYVQLTILFNGILLFLVCFPLAQNYQQHGMGKKVGLKTSWLSIIFHRNQIGALGILVGIVLNLNGVERPGFGKGLLDGLIHLIAWMQLVPVGHLIHFGEMRQYGKSIQSILWIKNLWTPFIVGFLAIVLLRDPVMRNTLIVLSFAPTAVNAVITVKLHNLNVPMVMTNFVISTAIYVLIVYPLLFFGLNVLMP
jgi:predicted permease